MGAQEKTWDITMITREEALYKGLIQDFVLAHTYASVPKGFNKYLEENKSVENRYILENLGKRDVDNLRTSILSGLSKQDKEKISRKRAEQIIKSMQRNNIRKQDIGRARSNSMG